MQPSDLVAVNQRREAPSDDLALFSPDPRPPAYTNTQGVVDLQPGDLVVVIKRRVIPMGTKLPYDDQRLIVKALVLGGQGGPPSSSHTAYAGKSIIYHRYILIYYIYTKGQGPSFL